MRQRAKKALYAAAISKSLTPDEIKALNLSALDQTAYILANRAACGDADAGTELLDRVMGKPKQQIEQKTVTLTLDDVLNGVGDDGENTLSED